MRAPVHGRRRNTWHRSLRAPAFVVVALGCGLAAAMGASSPATAQQETSGAHGKAGTGHTLADGLDATELDRRLAAKGMSLGSPIMMRIFKAEDELEVWMRKGERFELLSTYPICTWSGVLGPKLSEGDRQSPEGLYAIGRKQLHRTGRWRRSLDIGFPNAFDRAHGRTGSYILLHGGCSSIGCFAMTNPVMDEIFALAETALRNGQQEIPIHTFPFRMTQANLDSHADHPWAGFWRELKVAYDLFERTRQPLHVRVCNKQYVVSETEAADACVEGDGEGQAASKPPRNADYVAPAKVAPRRPTARQAYAAARVTRMAAHQRRQAAASSRGSHR